MWALLGLTYLGHPPHERRTQPNPTNFLIPNHVEGAHQPGNQATNFNSLSYEWLCQHIRSMLLDSHTKNLLCWP